MFGGVWAWFVCDRKWGQVCVFEREWRWNDVSCYPPIHQSMPSNVRSSCFVLSRDCLGPRGSTIFFF
jgi:hypothetical protein